MDERCGMGWSGRNGAILYLGTRRNESAKAKDQIENCDKSILPQGRQFMQAVYKQIDEIPADKGLPTLEEYADGIPTLTEFERTEGRLLRMEWGIIVARAHLEEGQDRAFTWYHIHGMSLRDTGTIMGCDESTVRYYLKAAYSRLRRVKNVGLLTVLIEIFGLADVMMAMKDK
jgi:hypothetical protein